MTFERVSILGAGAWGVALANVVTRAGRRVRLCARDPATAAAIARTRESPRLPGIRLDEAVTLAGTLDPAAADVLLLVVPAQSVRAATLPLARLLPAGLPVVVCAKGIERGTRKFMTEVIAETLPSARPAILSGPSFANDVARGLPTAVTLAAAEDDLASALAHALGSATFRPYHSSDVRGVEIGGAAKNVLAIAAGIVAGRGLGASAAAALTTRGFAELVRFGRAFDARPETLTGLSGLGDLILTCSGAQSRNFSLGLALGKGLSVADAARLPQLAEGAFTAGVLVEMAQERRVDMPISAAVAAVLDGSLTIDEAIEQLLTRPFRAEG
ncbi:MAG TPA: NAD(P)H-dependent glycerol-3-phosphate dehydrogenase [Xanthobacteraceae bacterium]|nr:NAD(P)H-dependent glycerol-3-phosphate dehydrogenase [Xanthobacteraceae bacterium]